MSEDIATSTGDHAIPQELNSLYSHTSFLDDQRLILLKEVLDSRDKVAVISGGGGGEGYEHFNAGLVGPGLLSAAVLSQEFSPPKTENILAAVRAVKPANNAGVLALVVNDTRSRLNFSLAVERARNEGINAEMVTLGEEQSLTTRNKMLKHSGTAASLLAMRVACALADKGTSLETIVDHMNKFLPRVATASLAITPCYATGLEPVFRVESNEVRVGSGSNQENVALRQDLVSAKEIAATVTESAVGDQTQTKSWDFKPGARIALIVNCLGNLSQLDRLVCIKQILQQLEARGLTIFRCWLQSPVTPQENGGLQISLFVVDDHALELLDSACLAPAWPLRFIHDKSSDPGAWKDDCQVLKDEKNNQHARPNEDKKCMNCETFMDCCLCCSGILHCLECMVDLLTLCKGDD